LPILYIYNVRVVYNPETVRHQTKAAAWQAHSMNSFSELDSAIIRSLLLALCLSTSPLGLSRSSSEGNLLPNIVHIDLRHKSTINAHLMFRPSEFRPSPPMGHTATVRAAIELDVPLGVFTHIRLNIGVFRNVHRDFGATVVCPQSTVLVTYGAVTFIEDRGFGRQLDLNPFAVAASHEGLLFAGRGLL
jgi:hypothetical protein